VPLDALTKAELQALSRRRGHAVPAAMTKSELVAAVAAADQG